MKKKSTDVMSQSNIVDSVGSIDRREFLGMAAASLSFSMLSGCLWWCRKEPTDVISRFPVIDIHTHIFNGEDMPIKGFIQNVILKDKYPFLNPLVSFLESIVQGLAPGFQTEMDWLDKLDKGISTEQEWDIEEEENFKKFKKKTDDYINNKILNLRSLSTKEQQFIEELRKEVKEVGNPDIHGYAALLFISLGIIGRYFKWATLFIKYRYNTAKKLISTYSEDKGSVELYTPALLDYDAWLIGDNAKVSMDQQMELMDRITELLFKRGKGSVHPYVAFDPWRSSVQNKEPQAWVENAIKKQGAIGVKIYPPMGFRAIDNEKLRFHNNSNPKLGKDIDEELLWLYQYCLDNEVPIIAHCNNTLYSRTEYEDERRAHPKWWSKLLNMNNGHFSNLRLNLTHFEGSPDPNNEWADTIGKLMRDFPNVYADVGHHETVLGKKRHRKKYFEDLKAFLDKFNIHRRLMYGSDWSMLARERKHKKYFEYFTEGFDKYFGQPAIDNFLGGNAARFLFGQDVDNKNRIRLVNYYKKFCEKPCLEVELPDWFIKLEKREERSISFYLFFDSMLIGERYTCLFNNHSSVN